VGKILNWLLDKAPDIIKAVQNPLGLACLIVLVLGIVGVLLFRKAAEKLRLVAFAMITGGLFGLFIFASNPPKPDGTSGDSNSNTDRIPEAERKAAADCAHYAALAFADYKRMMEIPKCQENTAIHFIQWQSSYESYLNWCHLNPSWLATWMSELRDAHLRQCGAR
jgi:hypothetical protein